MVRIVREDSSSWRCLPCAVCASVKAKSRSTAGTHPIRSALIRLTLLQPTGLALCMPECFGQGCRETPCDSVTDRQA